MTNRGIPKQILSANLEEEAGKESGGSSVPVPGGGVRVEGGRQLIIQHADRGRNTGCSLVGEVPRSSPLCRFGASRSTTAKRNSSSDSGK